MSKNREIYKFLIKAFNAYGLGFEGGRKLTVTAVSLSAIPFLTILLMRTNDFAIDIEGRARLFQIIPLFLVMGVNALNVKIKFGSILSLIESTNKMLADIGENEIVKQSQKTAIKITKLIIFIKSLMLALGHISPFFTHKLPIPVLTPIVGCENVFFWLTWFIFTYCVSYAISLSFAMDTIILYFMMSFKGYVQVLNMDVSKDDKKRKEIALKFMKQAYDLKM